ncbi:hypothetical protein BDN70DRAFT_844906 [Pholiota conissans]|uniref:Peptidase C14 caspase domain-containing protein n=1 Tax=Pholiota conissans TaxID=109636 RepID=A0A9P6CSE4_9AGAR|nr:hypothetical protein BDN70DRAFT_844906 [Pholiota conissans]
MSMPRFAETTMNRQELVLSLWNKAGASNPDTLSPWTYKRPTVVSSPDPRFVALLIGINHYRSENVKPLQGAVADVLAFKEHLEVDLGIPPASIRTLLNSSATRITILEAIRSLQNDDRVANGDPILIYYAGHGGEISSQSNPIDKKRFIVPYDYLQDEKGNNVDPISHVALFMLFSELVEKKGDNITVILDCSYALSPSVQDEYSTIRARSTRLNPLKSSDLHINPWSTGSNDEQPAYTLLSACSYSEVAHETFGRGNFSKALLHLLRRSSPHELRYSDVISRIDQIPGQTPQCVGRNKDRSLFDSKVAVTQRTCFHLTKKDDQFILHAGTIHGIASGAQFTLYANDDLSFSMPLAVMAIDTLGAFSTTLQSLTDIGNSKSFDDALALQTKLGTLEDVRFYIPLNDIMQPCYEAVVELMRQGHAELENIFLVDSPNDAHIEIAEENGKAVFLIRDQRITQYGLTRLFESAELAVEDLIPILKAAAHYYWKINRTNVDPDISTKVQVEFYRLEDLTEDDFGESEFTPSGTNLYHDNIVEFVVEEDCPYGLNLINNSPYDLYPYMFYFDNSDLSIGAYYQPTATEDNLPPLKKNGGSLTIGYGPGSAAPFAYYLRDNQDLDLGFLKLFLTTKPVDLSNIPQSTPFETTRSASRFVKSTVDTWSTILIPVIQHRYPPNSKPCSKCGHVTFDTASSNIFALKVQIDELKGERDAFAQRLAQEQRRHQEDARQSAIKIKALEDKVSKANGEHPKPTRKSTLPSLRSVLATFKFKAW